MAEPPHAGEPGLPPERADPRRRHHARRRQLEQAGTPAAGGVRPPWTLDLAFVWAGLIAFAVLAYVVLDGFDLGVGILFPYVHGEADRDQMMNSVAPVWDGNETWLVLGGGGLFAVFPLAYAVIMPALYAPIIAMLLGLIFRGVAFEFRWRTRRGKFLWDWAFAGGSTVAAFAQGVALGALVQGIPVANRAYAGGWWDWLTPFSLLTGVALVVGYALLGATWLVCKTRGRGPARGLPLRLAHRPSARSSLIGAVSLWTPFLDPAFMARWLPGRSCSTPPRCRCWSPALPSCCSAASRRRHELAPFLAALALFVLSYVGLGDQLLPVHRAGLGHDLGSGRAGQQPALPAGRRRGAGAADPALHRLLVLGVPRQGERRRRLSLMQRGGAGHAGSRLAWFVGLWVASVAALGVVAWRDPLGDPAVSRHQVPAGRPHLARVRLPAGGRRPGCYRLLSSMPASLSR